ncbi:MAG: type IV pilin N-terminal domain-containing protein [Thermoplasmata archaeon]
MKKCWVKDDAVSPVIATILMVAITVVLAAVLYVMVIGMGGETGTADLPMGLSQQTRNETSVTALIASAPNAALIDGSVLQVTSGGIPMTVNATVYNSEGRIVCNYTGNAWDVTDNTMRYTVGMQIVITAAKIQNGDKIVITGLNFGTTVMTID